MPNYQEPNKARLYLYGERVLWSPSKFAAWPLRI